MGERKISMLAIRYLSTICEALNAQLYRGMLPMERVPAAAEHCMRCADHIEHIAGDDIEEVGAGTRLRRIADSMEWLVSVRQEFDRELMAAGLYVPSVIDLDAASATALRLVK